MAQIKSKHELSCSVTELTAGLVKEFLEPVGDDSPVTIKVDYADRPGEISMVRMTASVDINSGRIY